MALAYTVLTGASVAGGGGAALAAPSQTTPALSTIIVALLQSEVFTSVTDNKGNTYTKVYETTNEPGSGSKTAFYACVGATGGASHIITANGGDVSYGSMFPIAVTGYDTTTPWLTFPVVANTGTGNSLVLNQPALAQANCLLLMSVLVNGAANNPTMTPPTGFTSWFNQGNWSYWTGFGAVKVTSATTAINHTATGSDWNSTVGAIIGMREAASTTLSASGAQTLATVTQTATVTHPDKAAATQTLATVGKSTTAKALAKNAAAQTLGSVTQTAAAVQVAPTASAQATQTLPDATSAATAVAPAKAAATQTLDSVSQGATLLPTRYFPAAPIPADPSFANVSFLLKDGADISASAAVISISGDSFTYPPFGMFFFGTGGTVQVPASTGFSFGSGDFSIEMVIEPADLVGNKDLFGAYGTVNPDNVVLQQRGAKVHMLASFNGSSWAIDGGSAADVFTANAPHHINFKRTSGVFSIDVNGIEVYTNSSSAAAVSWNASNPVRFGRSPTGANAFFGPMYRVRVSKGITRPSVIAFTEFPGGTDRYYANEQTLDSISQVAYIGQPTTARIPGTGIFDPAIFDPAIFDCGTLAQTLGSVTQTAAVARPPNVVVATQTLATVTQTSTAKAIAKAAATQALDAATSAASSVILVTRAASADQTLASVVQASTVVAPVSVATAQTLGSVSQGATATAPTPAGAVANQTLASVGQTATAKVNVRINTTQTLESVGQAATAGVFGVRVINTAQTLDAVTRAITASAIAKAASSKTLDAAAAEAQATALQYVAAAQTLASVIQTAGGTVADTVYTIVAVQQLASVTQLARAQPEYIFERNQRTLVLAGVNRVIACYGQHRGFAVDGQDRSHGIDPQQRGVAIPALD